MIDTIHFTIEGAKYVDVFNYLVKKASQIQKYGLVKSDHLLHYQHVEFENKSVGRFVGFYKIPSSNYNINFQYNRERNSIHFNVSIPKYYKGNNIYQLLIDNNSFEFNLNFHKFDKQVEYIYKLLIKFFYDFNDTVCNGKILIDDICIKRIDLCYNLIFQNETQLDIYFKTLKTIRKKYERDNSNLYRNYETAIFYVGKGYSFKIYKKHAEFMKNDYKELLKYEHPHAEILKEYSKNVLRFEVTYQNTFLSLFYNRHIFRRKCIQWQIYKKQYRRKLLTGSNLKSFEKALNIRRDFMIGLPENIKESNRYTDSNLFSAALFSKKLLQELCYDFKRKIAEFSVSVYNSDVKELADPKDQRVLKTALAITKTQTLDEYYLNDGCARATYHRYKRLLKRYGQLNNNLKMNIPIKFDYERYFTEMNVLGLLTKVC